MIPPNSNDLVEVRVLTNLGNKIEWRSFYVPANKDPFQNDYGFIGMDKNGTEVFFIPYQNVLMVNINLLNIQNGDGEGGGK